MKAPIMILLSAILAGSSPLFCNSFTDTIPTTVEEIYHVNRWITGGIAAAGIAANAYKFEELQQKPKVTQLELDQLNRDDIPSFDRAGLRQDVDKLDQATRNSNIVLWTSTLLPAGLFLDRRIRKDWFDITLMYLETQAIASNFYSWSPLGPSVIDRLRPRAYYEELSLEEKESPGTRNSFFSGHANSTAVGSFFFAKVLTDYHPEWSAGKKGLIYGLAAIPPVLVSIERVRALRHWPSDTVVGSLVGAGIGILMPHLHKRWAEKHQSKLQVNAVYNANVKGLGLGLTF